MTIVQTIIAGLLGTASMSVVMALVHKAGWANADMIRALGSLYTKTYENALKPGLLIHFTSGALFAFPYTFILGGFALDSPAAIIGLGGLLGFVHGFVMSFIVVAMMSEIHPIQQFRHASVEVAAAHIAGHVAYGLGVGAVVGLLHVSFGFRL